VQTSQTQINQIGHAECSRGRRKFGRIQLKVLPKKTKELDETKTRHMGISVCGLRPLLTVEAIVALCQQQDTQTDAILIDQ